jgi:hypothetical protein
MSISKGAFEESLMDTLVHAITSRPDMDVR